MRHIFKLLLPVFCQTLALFCVYAQEQITYDWVPQYYVQVQGEPRLGFAASFERNHLAFVDIDGDQDDDLFIGKADGRIAFFENTGTRDESQFELRTEYFQAWHFETTDDEEITRVQRVIDVGGNASPAFVDIDGDQDFDLFIGSRDGTLFYYQNHGNPLLPMYELSTPSYMSLRPGMNTVPRFQDVNADRAPDLLVGTHEGDLWLYLNSGNRALARFCEGAKDAFQNEGQNTCPFPGYSVGSIEPEVDAVPTWLDWDHDGDWDMVVGKASGKMSLYLNEGNMFEGQWTLKSDRLLFIDAGGYAAPTFYDLNHDGFPELFIGSSTSDIAYYQNREIFQTALKKLSQLDVSLFNWKAPPLSLLKSACEQLGAEPACLPELANAFRIPVETEASLEGYLRYIMEPRGMLADLSRSVDEVLSQDATSETTEDDGEDDGGAGEEANSALGRLPVTQANAPDPEAEGAPAEGEGEDANATEESVEEEPQPPLVPVGATRNHFWLASHNYLNFFHFIDNEHHAVVSTGDLNADGTLDLVLGSHSGKLFAYINQGSPEVPDWHRVQYDVFAPNQRQYSAPLLIDLDQDQDLDLLVGNQEGRLEYIENEGTAKEPKWKLKSLFYANIDVGSRSVPTAIDIDSDGDQDLFVGNSRGHVIFYLNTGSAKKPQFLLQSTRFTRMTAPQYAAPTFFKWGNAPGWDLVLGGRDGRLQLIVDQAPDGLSGGGLGWNLQDDQFQNIKGASHVAPHFADLNGDQKPDLLVGDHQGRLRLWKNGGFQVAQPIVEEVPLNSQNMVESTAGVDFDVEVSEDDFFEEDAEEENLLEDVPYDPIYVLMSSNYGSLEFGKRAAPAFMDVDGDDDMDLIVGNKEGKLFFYENVGTPEEAEWELKTSRFLQYSQGGNATPAFGDLDQDGDLDLLVGNEYGLVHYWENQGAPEGADFRLKNGPFVGVTAGRNARPSMYDLDQDGRMDVILGNFRGQLVVYQQEDVQSGFKYQLIHRRYLNLDVGLGATPYVADINKDGVMELVVGSDQGSLKVFFRQDDGAWGWQERADVVQGIRFPAGSFPAFTDIDADGDQDLFVGSEDGFIYFYRNEGLPDPSQLQ